MLRGMKLAAVAVLSVVGMTGVAQADHWSWGRTNQSCEPSYSRWSSGYEAPGSYGRNYDRGIGEFGGSYGSYWSRPSYHNTSHYDYHPTEVRVHRNHLHVSPGHYDYHRSGHWDR